MKFSFGLVILGVLGLASAAPTSDTNAARLARGLPLKAPSRVSRRTLHPRQSGSSNQQFNVAGSPTSPEPPSGRKRAPDSFEQGYLGVSDGGEVVYSTNPSDAESFYLDSSATPATMYWTASRTINSLDVERGSSYPVVARPIGEGSGITGIWSIIVEPNPQEGDITDFFGTERFAGDLRAQPAPMDHIWFAVGKYEDGSDANGRIGLANDFNKIVQLQSGDVPPTEILVQTISSAWSNSAALDYYSQGIALVNPVMLYGTDYTTQIQGYVKMLGNDFLLCPATPENAASIGTTFYLPLLNSKQSYLPLIYSRGGALYSLNQAVSNYNDVYYLEGNAFTKASTSEFTPSFGVIGQQYGTTSFGGMGAFGLLDGPPSTVAFTQKDGLSLSQWGKNQPLCLERLGLGATPSACGEQYHDQEFLSFPPETYIQPMSVFIYDSNSDLQGYWTLNGPVDDGAVFAGATDVPYTTVSLFNGNQGMSQALLWSFYQGKAVTYYVENDSPVAYSEDMAPEGLIQLEFNLPEDYSATKGGIVTTSQGGFYYQVIDDEVNLIVSTTTPAFGRSVCVELVPPGGSPQYCTPA